MEEGDVNSLLKPWNNWITTLSATPTRKPQLSAFWIQFTFSHTKYTMMTSHTSPDGIQNSPLNLSSIGDRIPTIHSNHRHIIIILLFSSNMNKIINIMIASRNRIGIPAHDNTHNRAYDCEELNPPSHTHTQTFVCAHTSQHNDHLRSSRYKNLFPFAFCYT